ncbi:hypothetical protein MICRO8M_80143 [Microbacterium sp. 8M]|nr:hypothetical protein MICRO8M_80143 [Microbacterium sp. 8M]
MDAGRVRAGEQGPGLIALLLRVLRRLQPVRVGAGGGLRRRGLDLVRTDRGRDVRPGRAGGRDRAARSGSVPRLRPGAVSAGAGTLTVHARLTPCPSSH